MTGPSRTLLGARKRSARKSVAAATVPARLGLVATARAYSVSMMRRMALREMRGFFRCFASRPPASLARGFNWPPP